MLAVQLGTGSLLLCCELYAPGWILACSRVCQPSADQAYCYTAGRPRIQQDVRLHTLVWPIQRFTLSLLRWSSARGIDDDLHTHVQLVGPVIAHNQRAPL